LSPGTVIRALTRSRGWVPPPDAVCGGRRPTRDGSQNGPKLGQPRDYYPGNVWSSATGLAARRADRTATWPLPEHRLYDSRNALWLLGPLRDPRDRAPRSRTPTSRTG